MLVSAQVMLAARPFGALSNLAGNVNGFNLSDGMHFISTKLAIGTQIVRVRAKSVICTYRVHFASRARDRAACIIYVCGFPDARLLNGRRLREPVLNTSHAGTRPLA